MEKLVCSICGYTGNQKRFKRKAINDHFDNAIQIWCPTNKCITENKDKRVVPAGCIRNWWIEYGGWFTIEEKPKVVDMETVRALHRAKQLRDIGLQMIHEEKEK